MTDRLIYAALVAVWMAYLIPMGIRRYREVSAHGSIKSFSSSMLALGRSPSAPETALGGTPPGQPVPARPAQPQPAVADVLDRASARQAAARRRRTLLVLLALVAVTGVAVVLTSLLWPAILVPIALVVAFLIVCHIQVARLEDAAWKRAAAEAKRSARMTAAAPVRFGGDDEDTLVIRGPAVAGAPVTYRPPAASASELQPAVARGAHPATPVESQPAVAVAHGAHPAHPSVLQPAAAAASIRTASPDSPHPGQVAHGASPAHPAAAQAADASPSGAHPAAPDAQPAAPATWDLRPITLPTYITKSRARRTVRSVDRPASSSWSSGRSDDARTVREEPSGKPVQQRRAVSG